MVPVTRYQIQHPPDCSLHRIVESSLHDTDAIQCYYTPLSRSETIPFWRLGGDQSDSRRSAFHLVSSCTNSMWSHSSWESQLSKTIDLEIPVQVDSVSCNCNQKCVHGNLVSCKCNKNITILTNQSDAKSNPVSYNADLNIPLN